MELEVNEYIRTNTGRIDKFKELKDNWYYNDKGFFICFEKNIVKHSKNIIDLIEDEDIVILEYKSPKYRERIIRKFNVCIIDNDINFENAHCNFYCKIGDKKIKDNICKNIKIKSVVSKEQFSNIEYIVEE